MQNAQASHFLSLLDPTASAFTFQMVPEPKWKPTTLWPQVLHGSLNDLLPKLTDLNRQGAAIYVTVNETDGKGRKASNVTRVRAIWQDDDRGYKGDFPLQPSMIISSSLGKFQRYWLSGELSKEDYKGLMGTMINEYGSDKDCGTDLARVLRVPGFYHNKAQPYLATIVEASGRRYTGAELLKAFPPIGQLSPQLSAFAAASSPPIREEAFRIKKALELIDPDPYDKWVQIGQILHGFYRGHVEGLHLWMGWAQASRKFNLKEHRYKWGTFGRSTGRQLGVGTLFRLANEAFDGMNLHVSSSLDHFTEDNYSDGELTDKTLSDLRSTFPQYGHAPSQAMWVSLRALIDALEGMANGTLHHLPYLSPLDPGVGKTEAVVHFIRNLLASPSHSDVGILICVSHLREIGTLIRKMRMLREEVAVFTRDDETNVMGSADIDNARVLFVTQQMVDSRLSDGKAFRDLSLFNFKGSPRQVKIWDEAMLPAEELTLNVDALARLPSLLRKISSPLADRIHTICEDVRSIASGTTYRFPDFVGEYELDYEDAKAGFSKEPTRDREASRILWSLSGKLVRVRMDLRGNTLLDYRNHLPEDFYPVVILDASGRVRTTYENWQKDRRNLVKLATADKRYDNLTIHVWNRGGGKSAFRTNLGDLIEGIAATINTKPEEQWLVVLHKEDEFSIPSRRGIPDLMKLISDLVAKPTNVKSLTWGNEKATNEFSGVKNVILAGTLFYPKSVYEVRARASKGLDPAEELDMESYKALEMGEHKNLILQAACRGSVRKCVGDQCAAMDLYLIASNKTGIPYVLKEIFPGAKLEPWLPNAKPLSGKVGEAVQYISTYFHNNDGNWAQPLSFTQVREAIGMKCRQNFNQNIRKHPDFQDALIEINVSEFSLNNSKRLTHFRSQ